MKRKASAVWQGTGLEGKGTMTTKSGVFDKQPYSFESRFKNEEDKLGTNPEELIAAAHAGCFNMALSFQIVEAGYVADRLHTEAIVSLDKVGEGFEITSIVLNLEGSVAGMDKATFLELAGKAKAGCPISKALSSVDITLNATFV